MPALLDEVRDLLAAKWPDYAGFLDEHHPEVAEAGLLFIHRLLDMAQRGLTDAEPPPSDEENQARLVFEQIGRRQFQRGHDVSDLLGAYQVGARVAWRHVSTTALELGMEPDVLAALAEAVFVFVDQFSTASANGYVLEQSASSAARERYREELSELLLSGRADNVDVRAAALHAAWTLPREAVVALAEPDDSAARTALERFDRACLPVRRTGIVGIIVPDPVSSGRMSRLHTAVRGTGAVVGYPVPLALLPAGMGIAQLALRLRQCGLLDGEPVFAADHLDTIIANRDEWLMGLLREQVLQPLDDVSPTSRARLIETLRSWLWNMGDRQAVARELHIHPQTVRYRIDQLREHFGERLNEPRERARLYLALVLGPSGDGR
jgi:hypothetical protein